MALYVAKAMALYAAKAQGRLGPPLDRNARVPYTF
jgi:hypothetical protein